MLAGMLVLFGRLAWADDGAAPSGPAENVYIAAPTLPAGLKRVVVLPLANEERGSGLAAGGDILNPVLRAGLVKTGKFEVVAADPETLCNCTGSSQWTGEEALPANFFESLKGIYGCDAVLFCQLTQFRSMAPLAIGWRLKLVDVKTTKIIWAADEIFDAANLDVAKAAKKFERDQQPHHNLAYNVYSFFAWCVNTPTRSALDEQWEVLNSPRYFGVFSIEQVLKTLPQR